MKPLATRLRLQSLVTASSCTELYHTWFLNLNAWYYCRLRRLPFFKSWFQANQNHFSILRLVRNPWQLPPKLVPSPKSQPQINNPKLQRWVCLGWIVLLHLYGQQKWFYIALSAARDKAIFTSLSGKATAVNSNDSGQNTGPLQWLAQYPRWPAVQDQPSPTNKTTTSCVLLFLGCWHWTAGHLGYLVCHCSEPVGQNLTTWSWWFTNIYLFYSFTNYDYSIQWLMIFGV